jgi:4-amino-4-deoxy-L-arabinose transferase-like glycosyltransferase
VIDVPRITAVSRGFLASILARPTSLAGLGALLAVAAFNLWITPSRPPGFLPDEASMSYNAYLLGHHLRDENGGLLPLYLASFGDYKSPLFTYTLALVFRVTGPHSEVARGLAAVGILSAVLLLGLLARRRTGSNVVALAVIVLAGLTPWLFEIGRAAFEVALEPLVICLFLLAVEAAWRKQSWTVLRGATVGLGLTGIAFVYAAGRLLAPVFALALLVFATRGRWRWLAAAWGTFVLTAVVPIASYWFRHPGALTERYDQTSFITSSMAPWTIVGRAVANYVHDVNLWDWIVSGDPKP